MRSTDRIRSLDGLRGICAIIVMFFHWWLLSPTASHFVFHGRLPPSNSIDFLFAGTPLNVLLAGSSAVLIFFVISGAVLALTFSEVDQQQYLPFILKRFCRIYLPYLATIILSLIAMLLVRPTPVEQLSPWFNTYSWSHGIGVASFLHYVVMTNQDITLNPAIWSLAHELRISFLFPLIFYVLRWGHFRALVAITALSFVAAYLSNSIHFHWVIGEIASTTRYIWLFAFGAALYLWQPHAPYLRTGIGRSLLWLISFALIFWATLLDPLLYGIMPLVASGVGAIIVVALALSSNWISDSILASDIAIWFGKISYSLYLIHIPMLLSIEHLFYGKLSEATLCVIGIPSSIGVAWIMSATIERSSQALGRRLARAARNHQQIPRAEGRSRVAA